MIGEAKTNALEWLLALVLIGAVLALGAVLPLAYSLVEVLVFLEALLYVARQTLRGKIQIELSLWPLLFLLLVLVQTLPFPASWVLSLSPHRLPEFNLASRFLGARWLTLTIYPHDTLLGAAKFLAYLVAFCLAVELFDTRREKGALVRALVFLAGFEGVYGIVQYLTGWQKIFTYTKEFNLVQATGTYINPNHYAGLIELTLPFILAAAFYHFQLWSDRSFRAGEPAPEAGGGSHGAWAIFLLFWGVIAAVGLIYSRSRGGIIACLFSIIFMGLLAHLRTRQKLSSLAVVIFVLCVTAYGLWIGLAPVLAKFETLARGNVLTEGGRLGIWRDTLRLIRDFPWSGTGWGTFHVAFQQYQSSNLEYYVDHAHNDYLEVASDVGFVGMLLLFVPIIFLWVQMVLSFLRDRRRFRRSVGLACVGSVLALLIHSFTDFNLQIPANALIFAVVLGIGYKAIRDERQEWQTQFSIRPRTRRDAPAAVSGSNNGLVV